MSLFTWSSAAAVAALTSAAIATNATRLVDIAPEEDREIVLTNPDMGWVLYENYPLDQSFDSPTLRELPDETFPEASAVAIMFSWQDIEREPDVYDFSKVDFAYDYWKQRGKSIQLRLSSETLVWWSHRTPPAGKGIPDYVIENVPAERKHRRESDGHVQTYVDARDPYYRERLRKFLDSTAAHFSGARAVNLVDLRGFGKWGEWHSGYPYATLEARREALSGVIDIWSAAFSMNWLALSYSYDPDGARDLYEGSTRRFEAEATSTYPRFLRFSAFDYALTKSNITLRRDGAGGAVHSNERKLCEEAFQTRSRGPMMCEFLGGYGSVKKAGADWVTWMVEDALSLHPNYINLLGWQGSDALTFIRERPDLIAHGTQAMGYRLAITRASFPAEINSGETVALRLEWVNRGVGRAMRDFRLVPTLRDAEGNVASKASPVTVETSRWVAGETYATECLVEFATARPGHYAFCLSLIDPQTNQAVGLPLKAKVADGVYQVGELSVH